MDPSSTYANAMAAMSEAAGDVVEQMWEQCGFSFICGKKTGVEGSTSWRGKLKQDVDG
jgi:hypothetical protein